CFAGTLAEIAFACDRSYMLIGQREGDNKLPASVALSALNFGAYPMSNDLTRLQSRFLGEPARVAQARKQTGAKLEAQDADALGLVTFALDDIDWDDEIRVFMEERLSFSPDALTGMEANLRFGGPETMETKIFARLTAWQNWIFQRPNAVGEEGALKRYGTGQKAAFDMRRGESGGPALTPIASVSQTRSPTTAASIRTAKCCARSKAGIRAISTGGRTWVPRAFRRRSSTCAPPTRSIRVAGPSSIMCACPSTAGAFCWHLRRRIAKSRSASILAIRLGKKCQANTVRCCAAWS